MFGAVNGYGGESTFLWGWGGGGGRGCSRCYFSVLLFSWRGVYCTEGATSVMQGKEREFYFSQNGGMELLYATFLWERGCYIQGHIIREK